MDLHIDTSLLFCVLSCEVHETVLASLTCFFFFFFGQFTSKAGATLGILDLEDAFDIYIQHQLVYQIEDTDIGPISHSLSDGHGDEDSTGGDSEGRGLFGQDETSHTRESLKADQEKSPRILYTRGMGLSPSPTHVRIFPDSPPSTGSHDESRQPGPEADNDKENEAPDDNNNNNNNNIDDAGHVSPRYQHTGRRDATVVHLPSSPLSGRGRTTTRQPLMDYDNDLTVPLSPSPPSSVQVQKREDKTRLALQAPSRIPVRAANSVDSSDIAPPRTVECLLSPRTPNRLPVSPTRLKERLKLPIHRQMKSDSGPRYIRRKTYSLDNVHYWQSVSKEDDSLAVSFGKDTPREETTSSLVRDWLRVGSHPEKFDKELAVIPQGESDATSPLQMGGTYMARLEPDDVEHQHEKEDGLAALSANRSQADNNIGLPSPSTASQLSMPWNSAEQLASEPVTTFLSEAGKESPEPKKLPMLEYSHGIIYVKFPEITNEGLFVCYATVHLHISSPDAAEGRSIDISCSTSEMERVAFNWGARSGPNQAHPSVPRVALVGNTSDTNNQDKEDMNKDANSLDEKESEAASDFHEEKHDNQTETHAESEIDGDWKRILRSIDFLGWFETQSDHLHVFLVRVQQQGQRTIAAARRRAIRPRHQLAILKYAVLAVICTAVLVAVNGHCHLNSLGKNKYPGSPGYYHQDSSSQLTFCEMWVRSCDAVKRRLERPDRYADAVLNGVVSEETTAWEGYKGESVTSGAVQPQEITEIAQAAPVTTSRVTEPPTVPVPPGKEPPDGAARTENEQLEENASDKIPPLRDRIDWFLGWKGPVECPAAGLPCSY